MYTYQSIAAHVYDRRSYRPEALVISLGVDTYEDDPISSFKLKTEDYLRLGERLATLGVPTLFVMEGGYNVGMIGVNVTNVLQAFENSTRT